MTSLSHLDQLEDQSVYIIREAFARFESLAMLWSIGKDSTVLLWLARKAFLGRVPFPLIHIDTSFKYPQMIAYRDRIAAEWGLRLLVGRNEQALAQGMCPGRGRLDCCAALKTQALQQLLDREGFKGVFLGIRRDEEGSRAKERYFSPRDRSFQWNYKDQPPELWDQFNTDFGPGAHVRIHPLLHWTEINIWEYIQRESIPVCPLYFSQNGKRFRSLGCEPCCKPIASSAASLPEIIEELRTIRAPERAGRAQDQEAPYAMQKLRAMGYM